MVSSGTTLLLCNLETIVRVEEKYHLYALPKYPMDHFVKTFSSRDSFELNHICHNASMS